MLWGQFASLLLVLAPYLLVTAELGRGLLQDALPLQPQQCSLVAQPGASRNSPPLQDSQALQCPVQDLPGCIPGNGTSLLGSAVFYGLGPGETIWDAGALVHPLAFAPGSNVTIACVSMRNAQLSLPSNGTQELPVPGFLQFDNGTGVSVHLRDVQITVDCTRLHQLQMQVCVSRPIGRVLVQSNALYYDDWQTASGVHFTRVTLTCEADTTYLPACNMVMANTSQDIYSIASTWQTKATPLVLVLQNSLNFSGWPSTGLSVKSDVTIVAVGNAELALDFDLQTTLFVVDRSFDSDAFLVFRGLTLLNLPLAYLPLDHPRRAFGVLSTSLWPVYRLQVAMHLDNCTLVLMQEEFQFWSYWLSIIMSPIPSVRNLGNWSTVSQAQVDPSTEDEIRIRAYRTRYSLFSNVKYVMNTSSNYTIKQRKNILQITGDHQVPPTDVYQVRDAAELQSALDSYRASASARGQFVVFAKNVTLDDTVTWPDGGLPLTVPLTMTAWPQTYAIFDCQLNTAVLQTQSPVTLKNLVVVNLGLQQPLPVQPVYGLVSGFWLFNMTTPQWEDEQQDKLLNLQRVALVVPKAEVVMYINMVMGVNSPSQSLFDDWVITFRVHSYDKVDKSWVYFTSITTERFTGSQINITTTAPSVDGVLPVDLPALPGPEETSSSSKERIVTYALLAVALPTALGASLLTFLWLKRRRVGQVCRKIAASDYDTEKDAEADGPRPARAEGQQPGCFWLYPCGKYVNPLYMEEGQPPPEVVLEGVLGVCHGHERGAGGAAGGQEEPPDTARQHDIQSTLSDAPDSGMPSVIATLAPAAPNPGAAAAPVVGAPEQPGAAVLDPEAELQKLQRLRQDIGDKQLEVHHSLGWGGCGVVYKGVWKGLPVAVKTVLIQGSSQHSQQYLMEAAISASLQHVNIVTTYLYELKPLDEVDGLGGMEIKVEDSDEEPSGKLGCWRLYIVQEYCNQGTLKTAIDQGHFVNPDGAVNMGAVLVTAADVLSGLVHIHNKNVVHGDLTVSNVLLQTAFGRPCGYTAKLADFGLSVKMEQGQSHMSRVYCGTPHYMAPEVQHCGHISKAADMYAVGVILWELYCGTPPWRSNAAAHRQAHSPFAYGLHGAGGGEISCDAPPWVGNPELPNFPQSCPTAYSALAAACMSLEPRARPSSLEVLATLQRLQQYYC